MSLHNGGYLLQVEYVEPSEHVFLTHCEFRLHFSGKKPIIIQLLEEVIRALYCNEVLYGDPVIGQVAMTCLDIALALGDPEAIAESFYSVMDTQRKIWRSES